MLMCSYPFPLRTNWKKTDLTCSMMTLRTFVNKQMNKQKTLQIVWPPVSEIIERKGNIYIYIFLQKTGSLASISLEFCLSTFPQAQLTWVPLNPVVHWISCTTMHSDLNIFKLKGTHVPHYCVLHIHLMVAVQFIVISPSLGWRMTRRWSPRELVFLGLWMELLAGPQ